MDTAQITSLSKQCRILALVSCMGGLALTLLYFITFSEGLLFFGYFYLLGALAINALVLLILMGVSVWQKFYNGLLKTALIMLANIPVAAGCAAVIFWLLNYLILTVENDTDAPIKNFVILNKNRPSIPEIKPHDSKTIWVNINCDWYGEVSYSLRGIYEEDNIGGGSSASRYTLVIHN